MQPLLRPDAGAHLSTEAKEALLADALPRFRAAAGDLSCVDELRESAVNGDELTLLQRVGETRLAPLQAVHVDTSALAGDVREQTEDLLAVYNDFMGILSAKFVLWDEKLRRAERK